MEVYQVIRSILVAKLDELRMGEFDAFWPVVRAGHVEFADQPVEDILSARWLLIDPKRIALESSDNLFKSPVNNVRGTKSYLTIRSVDYRP
jgi:hypothetical protein